MLKSLLRENYSDEMYEKSDGWNKSSHARREWIECSGNDTQNLSRNNNQAVKKSTGSWYSKGGNNRAINFDSNGIKGKKKTNAYRSGSQDGEGQGNLNLNYHVRQNRSNEPGYIQFSRSKQ